MLARLDYSIKQKQLNVAQQIRINFDIGIDTYFDTNNQSYFIWVRINEQ